MDTTELRNMVIPQFSDEQWGSIEQALDNLPLSEEEFSEGTGLDIGQTTTIFLGAYLLQMVNLNFLVFHKDSEIACNTRDYLDGFEPAPHQCPYCKDTIYASQQTYQFQITKI